MSIPKGQNPNRPPPGSSIKVEPIRTKKAIALGKIVATSKTQIVQILILIKISELN